MPHAADAALADATAPPAGRQAAAPPPPGPVLARLLPLIVPALLLGLWQVAAWLVWVPPNLLPSPYRVVTTVIGLARSGDLIRHLAVTAERIAAGFLLGAVAATLAGALTGYSRLWRAVLDPTLQALRNIPSIAWVPLFVLWLGIDEAPKVTLIAVGVFFPVYLNLMTAIAEADRKLIEVGTVFRLSGFALVRRVLLPATLPAYVVGLRAGLGLGWMFVVAAELMGASEGLGFLLVDGQMTGRPALVIASILLFALAGKATDLLLVLVTRPLVAWQDTRR